MPRPSCERPPAPRPSPLPGPPNAAIPRGVRVVANEVTNPVITDGVRFMRPWPAQSNDYYALPTRTTYTLELVLGKIAEGATNAAHANFNTRYYNMSRDLPSRVNPFASWKIGYYEYGWLTTIPQVQWRSWTTEVGSRPALLLHP